MVSCPSNTMQMSRSLCRKPKPFLDDPNSCSWAPVQKHDFFYVIFHYTIMLAYVWKYKC